MLDHEKAYTYMNRFHGPLTPSTHGWFDGVCPFCGKRKLAYHPDYMIVKCWVGCIKSFVTDLIHQFHGINYFEAGELIESMEPGLTRLPNSTSRIKASTLILPEGYTPILSGDTVLGERARNYLKGRMFDLNYLDRIGLGYCTEENKIAAENYFGYLIIPFKRDGLLSYFIARTFIDSFPRYKNPNRSTFGVGKSDVIFNEESLLLNDIVYQTEGWACAATLGSAGFSIQGSTPSTIQKNIVIKSGVKEVIIIPDAGFYKRGLETAVDYINYKKVKVLNLDRFQQEGKGKDVNEIGKEPVLDLVAETPYVTLGFLFKEMKKKNA
jgi:hypothetical protein